MTDSETPSRATPRFELAPSETLSVYDRWADSYDATDNPMVAATAWALRQRPFDVRGADVVEPGCGTGRHVEVVLAGGARSFVGVDGSQRMLDRARRRTADPRATWRCGELADLPVADAAFDRALVVLVFEHVHDLGPVFAEIARVLRRDGRMRVLDIHGDLVASGTNAHFGEHGAEVHFHSTAHAVAAFARELVRAGFVPARRLDELRADGELLRAVPRLAKHAGRPVLVDLEAVRT